MLNDDELLSFLEKALEKARVSGGGILSSLLKEVCVEAGCVPPDTAYSPTVEYLKKAVTTATQHDFVVLNLDQRINSPEATQVALELTILWAKSTKLKERLAALFAKHHEASQAAVKFAFSA